MLTPEQQEMRRGRCGGSDVAAILGLNPWRSPFEVWAEKTGNVVRDGAETPAQRRGRLLENAVAQWFSEETGQSVKRADPLVVINEAEPWMCCSPDRWICGADGTICGGLECKTTKKDDSWAEDGAEATGLDAATIIPATYGAQVLFSMEVTGLSRWDVACFFTFTDDFRRYTIYRDPEQGAALVAKVREWWQAHIIADVPPELDGSDAAKAWLLARFPHEQSSIRPATAEEITLVEQLRTACEAEEYAKQEKERLEALCKQAIGKAEGLSGDFGKLTWKAQKGARRIDGERLRKERPDVAEEFMTKSADLRVLRKVWAR